MAYKAVFKCCYLYPHTCILLSLEMYNDAKTEQINCLYVKSDIECQLPSIQHNFLKLKRPYAMFLLHSLRQVGHFLLLVNNLKHYLDYQTAYI